jgi:hypothetical protein
MTANRKAPCPSDCRILIVSANILGLAVLQALRGAGHIGVTVWERHNPSSKCRSIVRLIKRMKANLVADCGKNEKARETLDAKLGLRTMAFTHTIVCDGTTFPCDRQWGLIYTPKVAMEHLLDDEHEELRRPVLEILAGIRALTHLPGLPLTHIALRLADPDAFIQDQRQTTEAAAATVEDLDDDDPDDSVFDDEELEAMLSGNHTLEATA